MYVHTLCKSKPNAQTVSKDRATKNNVCMTVWTAVAKSVIVAVPHLKQKNNTLNLRHREF